MENTELYHPETNGCNSCGRVIGSKRKNATVAKITTVGHKRKLTKMAGSASSALSSSQSTGKNETHNDLIADSDRYLTDAYYIIISLRETVDGFSVACHVNAGQLGVASFAQYWHFTKDEYKQAKNTYEEAKKTSINLRKNIEFERLPFALILPMFRHETRKIDIEHVEVSRIPHMIYSLDVVQEKDWRKTLYGKRYPGRNPEILNYEVDHSIDEQSRYVTTTPGLGRDKLFKYKYEDPKPLVTAEFIPRPTDKPVIGIRRKQYTKAQPISPFDVNPNQIEPLTNA